MLVLAGCGQTHGQTHGRTLRLTAADNRTQLTLKRHQEFVITLPSVPSTGYRWENAPSSHPLNPIREVSHDYAAGKEIWRFRAVSHGGMELGFFYGRLLKRPRPEHWSINRRFDVSIDVG